MNQLLKLHPDAGGWDIRQLGAVPAASSKTNGGARYHLLARVSASPRIVAGSCPHIATAINSQTLWTVLFPEAGITAWRCEWPEQRGHVELISRDPTAVYRQFRRSVNVD